MITAAAPAAVAPDITVFLPLITGIILTVGGGIFAIYQLRLKYRKDQERPLPPTWPEMWAKISELDDKLKAQEETTEKRDKAIGNILTAIVDQWPADRPLPVFDPADLEIVTDIMPGKWARHRPRPATP